MAGTAGKRNAGRAIATVPFPRSQSVKLPVKIPVGFRVFYTVAMGDGKRKESE